MSTSSHQDELNEMILLRRLSHFLFGKEKISPLKFMMLLIHSLISVIFLFWHLISYFVIKNHELIIEHKKIDVDQLLYNRGAALGFDPIQFSAHLTTFHLLSAICWSLLLLLVFGMLRNHKHLLTTTIVLLVFYYGAMLLYLGPTYYKEDTTSFDKISLVLFLTNAVFYQLIHHKSGKEDFFEG